MIPNDSTAEFEPARAGRNRPSQKTVVESPFRNKPTQIAHTRLFAKALSTFGEFSGGWVDFAHRWLVLVRPVTSANPKVAAVCVAHNQVTINQMVHEDSATAHRRGACQEASWSESPRRRGRPAQNMTGNMGGRHRPTLWQPKSPK